jgi:hypothetical protein
MPSSLHSWEFALVLLRRHSPSVRCVVLQLSLMTRHAATPTTATAPSGARQVPVGGPSLTSESRIGEQLPPPSVG